LATKIGTAKISNSYRGLRFKITPRDIENGQPNDPCSCAAARALQRHFNAKEVRVYRNVTYVVTRDDKALRFGTTPALRLETIVFDRNGEFFPGEYDLAPGPLVRDVPKKQKSASAPIRKNSQRTYHKIPNVRPTASQKFERS